jgi:hypothetical protein
VATAPAVVTTDTDTNTITNTYYAMPPALILRGQYDFVSESNSLDAWSELLLEINNKNTNRNANEKNDKQQRTTTTCECMTLAGTSHYSMLEQEDLFGSVMTVFLQKHDPVALVGQQDEVPSFLRPAQHHDKHKHRHGRGHGHGSARHVKR